MVLLARGSGNIRDDKQPAWMLMAQSPFLIQHSYCSLFPKHHLHPVKLHLLAHDPSITSYSHKFGYRDLPNHRCTLSQQRIPRSLPCLSHIRSSHRVSECLSLKGLEEVGPPKDTPKLSSPWAGLLLSENRVLEKVHREG